MALHGTAPQPPAPAAQPRAAQPAPRPWPQMQVSLLATATQKGYNTSDTPKGDRNTLNQGKLCPRLGDNPKMWSPQHCQVTRGRAQRVAHSGVRRHEDS